jgi:uncharacterized protein YbaR (Trm112 family)
MQMRDLIDRLARWEHLGLMVYDSGTHAYGARSETRPRGWLHVVCCPLDKARLDAFADENAFQKAFRYPDQLLEFNGAYLFGLALCLYGLRLGKPKHGLDFPYSMVTPNFESYDLTSRYDGLIIGGANMKRRSYYYIETRRGEVLAIDRDTSDQVFAWPDYETFVTSEIDRLNRIFDADGQPPPDIAEIAFSTGG